MVDFHKAHLTGWEKKQRDTIIKDNWGEQDIIPKGSKYSFSQKNDLSSKKTFH